MRGTTAPALVAPRERSYTPRPGATGPQQRLLTSLRKELYLQGRRPVDAMTVGQASKEIDQLLARKRRVAGGKSGGQGPRDGLPLGAQAPRARYHREYRELCERLGLDRQVVGAIRHQTDSEMAHALRVLRQMRPERGPEWDVKPPAAKRMHRSRNLHLLRQIT